MPAADIALLCDLARRAFPAECCGLLVGTRDSERRVVTRLVPAANVHPEPEHHFAIDPALHFALLRELRAGDDVEQVLGHYHSHPNGRPEPSATDRAHASDADLVWVIIALDPTHVAMPRAWQAPASADRGESFTPVRLDIEEV